MNDLKRLTFDAFLSVGSVVLHVNGKAPNVDLPGQLREDFLILQYGNDLPVPMPDLSSNQQGVSATLSFARVPYHTFVPWTAISGVSLSDGSAMLLFKDEGVAGKVAEKSAKVTEAKALKKAVEAFENVDGKLVPIPHAKGKTLKVMKGGRKS